MVSLTWLFISLEQINKQRVTLLSVSPDCFLSLMNKLGRCGNLMYGLDLQGFEH